MDLKSIKGSFFPLKLLIACRYLQRYSTASSGTTQFVFSLISPHSLPWIIFRAPSPAVGDLCVYGHYWRWVIHFVFFLLLLSWQRHVAPWGISITRVCLTPSFPKSSNEMDRLWQWLEGVQSFLPIFSLKRYKPEVQRLKYFLYWLLAENIGISIPIF